MEAKIYDALSKMGPVLSANSSEHFMIGDFDCVKIKNIYNQKLLHCVNNDKTKANEKYKRPYLDLYYS